MILFKSMGNNLRVRNQILPEKYILKQPHQLPSREEEDLKMIPHELALG